MAEKFSESQVVVLTQDGGRDQSRQGGKDLKMHVGSMLPTLVDIRGMETGTMKSAALCPNTLCGEETEEGGPMATDRDMQTLGDILTGQGRKGGNSQPGEKVMIR